MAQTVALAHYYDRLKVHNWFFEMSDDPGFYRRGKDEHDALVAIGHQSQAHADLFKAMRAYHTENGDLPARPVEVAA